MLCFHPSVVPVVLFSAGINKDLLTFPVKGVIFPITILHVTQEYLILLICFNFEGPSVNFLYLLNTTLP